MKDNAIICIILFVLLIIMVLLFDLNDKLNKIIDNRPTETYINED
jgi:hypothetical protein